MTALALSACGGGGHSGDSRGATTALSAHLKPKRILPTPRNLLAAAQPQPNGTVWVLAGGTGGRSRTLFKLDPASGQVLGSIPVTGTARSVAQSATGLLGLAIGSHRAGALELLDAATGKVLHTVRLGGPASGVAVGSDGGTFYVLTTRVARSAVAVVDSRTGRVKGTVPVPGNAVSAVPDGRQASLYVLQRSGHVSEIAIAGGKVRAVFRVGGSGTSLAISPDGTTLYALKGTKTIANVAVVNVATEAVRDALPAPSHCLQVLVSASGRELYEVVGAPDYGNLQVFPA